MSFIEKLLNGAKVEWKTLGEVAELVRGNGLQKKDFTETGIPAIHYGQIYTYYGLSTTKTKSFVSPELASTLRKVNTGDIVITNTSENLEDVGKALVYLGETQAVTGGHATIIRPSRLLLGKYFVYFTQTEDFASQKKKYAKGTKVIDVSATDMSKFKIPIPPLAVQKEIVRILDEFTELTVELTANLIAELAARKKQYEYFREQLLSFDKDKIEPQHMRGGGNTLEAFQKTKRFAGAVEWKTLGEVVNFINAKPHEKLVDSTGDVALMTSRFISTEGKSARYVKSENVLSPALKNDVAMVMSDLPNGRALAKTFLVEENNRFAANQRVCLLRIKNPQEYLPKFLHFIINRNKQLLSYDSGWDQTHLKKDWILDISVPIPHLAEQARIVSILDTFNTLTISLSESLFREILLRKTQYEYYRNLLLTFV